METTIMAIPSLPPPSSMTAYVDTYAWPEIIRICAWVGGATLVTLVIKRLSAR